MRILTLLFSLFLIYLQYSLWFGANGYVKRQAAQQEISRLETLKNERELRNEHLRSEVLALKGVVSGKNATATSLDAIEERARLEREMIKSDEVFYRLIQQ